MSKSNRDPEKEKFWSDTIAEQQRSGISQAEYCRLHHLNENSFSWWKRELSKFNSMELLCLFTRQSLAIQFKRIAESV